MIRGGLAGVSGTVTTAIDFAADLLNGTLSAPGKTTKRATNTNYWLPSLASLGAVRVNLSRLGFIYADESYRHHVLEVATNSIAT